MSDEAERLISDERWVLMSCWEVIFLNPPCRPSSAPHLASGGGPPTWGGCAPAGGKKNQSLGCDFSLTFSIAISG